MLKLLFGVAVLVALCVAVALVPFRGATVLERWAVAPSTGAFVARTWHDAKVAVGLEKEKARPARAAIHRPARPAARPPRPAAPSEQHTEADRAALDRIVSEHATP
jgi:hypothetical protein